MIFTEGSGLMGRPNKMLAALSASVRLDVSPEFASNIFESSKPLSPEEELEARRSELRNGLTDMQRLFFIREAERPERQRCGDSAGYSVSVAENTKQRIWKLQVRAEFERLQAIGSMGNRYEKAREAKY